MGIFDFFKRMIENDDTEKIATEKLVFSDIENWVEKRIVENESKEKDVILEAREKIADFIKELGEKITALKNFDVEAKREEERIKNIVLDGREKYIEYLEELTKKLDNLEELKLEKFIEKTNKIFLNFNKKSFKNYERTTLLIGKEMGNIKKSLKVFSENLFKIFNKNKNLVNSFNSLLEIRKESDAVVHIDKDLTEIDRKKLSLDKKLNEEEKEIKILEKNAEEIKSSPVYRENLAKREKIESLRLESERVILELKQLIDFKTLISFFHINPEQMKIVKDYRENFQVNFEKDVGEVLIKLLDEAKLNDNLISEKINQIRTKVSEIENYEKEIKADSTEQVYLRIKKVKIDIDNLKTEKIKEEKRKDRLEENKRESINLLKKELEKMSVEII